MPIRFSPMTAKPWVEGEPPECDGSAWDRLPPLVIAAHPRVLPLPAIEAVVSRRFAVCADAVGGRWRTSTARKRKKMAQPISAASEAIEEYARQRQKKLKKPPDSQPRTIPNPLWCEQCEGRGYVIHDAEWEPYAVRCSSCARPALYTPNI
jgi:hypothetical protein